MSYLRPHTTATNTTTVALGVVNKLIAGLPEAPRTTVLRSMQSLARLVLAYLQSTFTVLQCTSLQMCVH